MDTVEAADLIAKLHGKTLRHLAASSGLHFAGLVAAARHKAFQFSSSQRRGLANLDAAFAVTRHITETSANNYLDGIIAHVEHVMKPEKELVGNSHPTIVNDLLKPMVFDVFEVDTSCEDESPRVAASTSGHQAKAYSLSDDNASTLDSASSTYFPRCNSVASLALRKPCSPRRPDAIETAVADVPVPLAGRTSAPAATADTEPFTASPPRPPVRRVCFKVDTDECPTSPRGFG